MYRLQIKWFVLAASLGLPATTVQAEEVNYGSDIPSSQELIDALKPKTGSFEAKTRGIVIKIKNPQTKALAKQPVPEKQISQISNDEQDNAASLQIQFEFDSEKLSAYGRLQLQPLGLALQSQQLKGIAFIVEGHTDATGPEVYNQSLSERRAKSIKNHLVSRYQIPEANLKTVGLGESRLLLPESPADASNRRVRIVSQI